MLKWSQFASDNLALQMIKCPDNPGEQSLQ